MPLPPLPRRITIVEVGPRDGLQNEATCLTVDARIAFVDALTAAGLPAIEVTAFVNPARVPQMADGAAVLAGITRRPGVRYTALVPNERGLAAAIDAGLTEVALFAAASDTFSRRNIGRGIEEAFEGYTGLARQARGAGLRVRGYLSTGFGCPFEGAIPVERVAALTRRMLEEWGVFEVAVSDTIGIAHPAQVATVLDRLLAVVPASSLALHFHDTRGTALANALVGLELGFRDFDASVAGLGGCPYAPGAAGNLATEDLVYMLHGMGVATGVDLERLVEAGRVAEAVVGRRLPGKVHQAGVPTLRA